MQGIVNAHNAGSDWTRTCQKEKYRYVYRNFFHNFFQTELTVKYAMSDSTEIEAEYEKFAKQRRARRETITKKS